MRGLIKTCSDGIRMRAQHVDRIFAQVFSGAQSLNGVSCGTIERVAVDNLIIIIFVLLNKHRSEISSREAWILYLKGSSDFFVNPG